MRSYILVVDDDVNFLSSFMRTISRKEPEWNIITCSNTSDAFQVLKNARIDVILTDVMMPVQDGFSFIQEIQRKPELSSIPIVMITGTLDSEKKLKALELGANDIVSKPIDVAHLIARLKSAINIKKTRDELCQVNSILSKTVVERTFQLQKSQVEVIWRLAWAAELRDKGTGKHVIRVGYYSQHLANVLGHGVEFSNALLLAAPLHDIGKIAIPDSVLLKNGTLTDTEMSVMKSHSELGSIMLVGGKELYLSLLKGYGSNDLDNNDVEENPLLLMAARIALYHHEKWDGSGYPYGLSSTDIPLEARIVCVADVYDALSSKRPYKPVYSEPQVIEIMSGQMKSQFDPDIHQALLDNREKLINIRAQYEDDQQNEVKAA